MEREMKPVKKCLEFAEAINLIIVNTFFFLKKKSVLKNIRVRNPALKKKTLKIIQFFFFMTHWTT